MKPANTPTPATERRKNVRTSVMLRGLVCDSAGVPSFTCAIRELTQRGARIALPSGRPVASEICLVNVRDKTAHDAILLWHNRVQAGFALLSTIALSPTGDARTRRLYNHCVGETALGS